MVNFADRAKNPSLGQSRAVSPPSQRGLLHIIPTADTAFQVLNILQTHCMYSFPLASVSVR